ncbi:ectonucleotide pyrophosphatase/phosphodiesterase [Novosphingobium sp.]|uniref:alkaline phosphatase family protein n=1 Tax=Novosphingobium sp. TaxID=1874826 RepID=UPI00333EEADD
MGVRQWITTAAQAITTGTVALAALLPIAAMAKPVLLISIDGLRPADVIEAKERGINLPNLTAFLANGSYAQGVVGVLPTLTYPSHTTLITGVSPAKHHIVANTTFDPMHINDDGWYWYAQDNTAETLWDAAFRARLTTGNVHWPVSVGANHVTWNLPQIWRTGHADDRKLVRALSTPGLVAELESQRREGYADGKDETLPSDKLRAGFAQSLIRHHQPGFITVYLTALDHQQHLTGPGSPEAHQTLEAIDGLVGDIMAIEHQFHPDAVVAVVSDHGFATVDTAINLYRPFIDAGLVTVDATGKISGWEASPWATGGSFAIVLARPDDAALGAKVGALLEKLAATPAAHIAQVITEPAIAAAGGNPRAAFYVNLKIGAVAAPFISSQLPMLLPSAAYKGMHGYFPAAPEMRSTFLIAGPGIAKARNLGEIDMRSIAPTLARAMGATLPGAEKPPLAVAP